MLKIEVWANQFVQTDFRKFVGVTVCTFAPKHFSTNRTGFLRSRQRIRFGGVYRICIFIAILHKWNEKDGYRQTNANIVAGVVCISKWLQKRPLSCHTTLLIRELRNEPEDLLMYEETCQQMFILMSPIKKEDTIIKGVITQERVTGRFRFSVMRRPYEDLFHMNFRMSPKQSYS